jgi:hypothetical protein
MTCGLVRCLLASLLSGNSMTPPTHYLLSASDVAAIHHALSINRVMAKDDQGNYTKEITPKPSPSSTTRRVL